MIKYFFYFSICFAVNPLDNWIDKHADILKQDIKSVSFQLVIDSEIYNTQKDSIIFVKILTRYGVRGVGMIDALSRSRCN